MHNGTYRMLSIALVICMSVAVIVVMDISDDDDAASQTVYSLSFTDGSRTDTLNVIGGLNIDLPTTIGGFNRSDTSSVQSYLSGWSCNGTVYPVGSSYTVTGPNTFQAVWGTLPGDSSESVEDTSATSSIQEGQVYTYSPIVDNKVVADSDMWYVFQAAVSSYGYYIEDKPNDMTVTWSNYTLTFRWAPTSPCNGVVDVAIRSAGPTYHIWWVLNVGSQCDGTFTVSYDTGTTSTLPSEDAEGMTVIRLPSSDSLYREGYTLLGWMIDDGKGGAPTYMAGGYYTVTGDVTAVAHWVSEPVVIVYTAEGKVIGHQVVSNDSYQTIFYDYEPPSGMTFLGWRQQYDDQAAFAQGLFRAVSGTLYLDAYLVPSGTPLYTVTYDANGGTVEVTCQQVERFVSGKPVHVYLPQKPIRNGYEFTGWSLDPDGEPVGQIDYPVTSDVTLFATWREITMPVDPEDPEEPVDITHKVYFYAEGADRSYTPQEVYAGTLVSDPGAPNRPGYIFLGWIPTNSTEYWDFDRDVVTEEMMLVADWLKHFTVTVDGLHVEVTVDDSLRSCQSTVSWGDYQSNVVTMVNGHAEYDYEGAFSGNITVTTKVGTGSTVKIHTSVQYISAIGDHEQDYPVGPDEPDPIGPGDSSIVPKASFTCIPTDGGYRLDASASSKAVEYEWIVDGESVFISDSPIYDLLPLEDGELHTIVLKVSSSTGNTHTASRTIDLRHDPETKDYSIIMLVGILSVIGVAAVVVIR